MPYAITQFGTGTGFARYQLNGSEEFTVEAASFRTDARSHNPPYGYPMVEWRDAAGGIIYRQAFNTRLNDGVWVAMATEGEPWYVSNNGQFGFPQATDEQSNAALSMSLPRITLTAGCIFGIYVLTSALSFEDDPMNLLSDDFDVAVPHLWVEPTDSVGRHLPDVGNAILLGISA